MPQWILVLIIAFGSLLQSASAFSADVELAVCKRVADAKFSLVYLHGLDPKDPSEQEVQNRSMLEKLAAKHQANLVVPRSNIFCKNEKRCWLHEDTTAHEKLYKEILGVAATCVTKPAPIVLVGFSNGGFFASKAAMLCYQGIDAVIASGSAGQTKNALSAKKQSHTCPNLTLTIGQQDITFKRAQGYYNALRALGYRIEFKTFKGRHELSMKTLDSVLEQIVTDLSKKKGS